MNLNQYKQKLLSIKEYAEPNLVFMGLLGGIGYPSYYIVWKYLFPQEYESLLLRSIMSLLIFPWLAHNHLPKKASELFPAYFFFSSFVVLPYFFSFMLLKNHCSFIWFASYIAGLFLLIMLIYDWLIICLMSLCGFLLAYGSVHIIDGGVSVSEFQPEYIPIYIFAFCSGIICNYRNQIANNSKMSLMRSLGGSIAHEMRNPLSSIINALDALCAFLPEKPAKNSLESSFSLSRMSLLKLHETLEESTLTIQRGNKIIDSILTSMKGEAINSEGFKRINVADLIQTTLASYGFDTPSDRSLIFVNTEAEFDFLGDKDLCIYVLFNLLKNSLYYKSGDAFRIDIATDSTPDHHLLKFRDNGIGIPPNKLDKIFDSFYTSGKSGGTGLGLHFCRQVMESLGGRITCASVQHKWTEFTLSFPKYDSSIVKQLKQRALKNKRILLVDDEAVCRLIAKKHLSAWVDQVDEAVNGRQALDMLSHHTYDLILMDIEMPIVDGEEAATRIRQGEDIDRSKFSHYQTIPIIAVSSCSAEALNSIVQRSGMNAFVEKPLTQQHIAEFFETYFFTERTAIPLYQDARLKTKRILLVDDNQTNRKLISLHLERAGALVVQAQNGQDALTALEQQAFDLILMDVEMPVLDGIAATRLIREGQCLHRFPHNRTIPIIALTGNTDQPTIESVKTAGMNDHIGKPATGQQIILVLNSWLTGTSNHSATQIASAQSAIPTTQEEVDTAPLLNIELLNSFWEVDVLMIQDIFNSFRQDTQASLNFLTEAKQKKDLKLIAQICHTLKGSAGNFGAHKLYLAIKEVHDQAHYNHWPQQQEWLEQIHQIFNATNAAFESYIAENI